MIAGWCRRAGTGRTSARLAAATVAVSVAVSGPAGSEPFYHHVSVEGSVYPWSSLVKIFNSAGGSCTGAVIAPDKVLTAGHCVYAFRTHRFLPPEALHVLLGYARGDYRIHARVRRYRLGPGYDPLAERATAAADWVVLDLAEPLPPDVRPLTIERASKVAEGPVALAGFARDRAYVMTVDQDCRVTGSVDAGRLIAHDCSVQPGDSGAPLLRIVASGTQARIVGVAIAIWHLPRGPIAVAAPPPPPDVLADTSPSR